MRQGFRGIGGLTNGGEVYIAGGGVPQVRVGARLVPVESGICAQRRVVGAVGLVKRVAGSPGLGKSLGKK